jgi:hypothetical protein
MWTILYKKTGQCQFYGQNFVVEPARMPAAARLAAPNGTMQLLHPLSEYNNQSSSWSHSLLPKQKFPHFILPGEANDHHL